MDTKALEFNSLNYFTLAVQSSSQKSEDAQWIAIGV